MDRVTAELRIHEIAESSHRILNAMSLDKLLLVGDILGLTPSTQVLDLCCGKAEMLTQWAARSGCRGHGVDLSTVFLDAAAARARELGVADRVTLSHGDAADFESEQRFDVVCCIGASWFAGDLARSVARMSTFAKPAATLVLGEPYWIREPPPGAADLWDEDFHHLPGLFEWIESVGLEVVEMVLSSPDDWDRYRAAQWHNLYRWFAANPTDPDAAAVRERLTAQRRSYVSMQRECLGWGIFVLKPRLN